MHTISPHAVSCCISFIRNKNNKNSTELQLKTFSLGKTVYSLSQEQPAGAWFWLKKERVLCVVLYELEQAEHQISFFGNEYGWSCSP